ncbi:MAG: URC4/urg3 family protein [Rhizobiales bacterium]|nr:URC4/urg3 family protein [Hyphomicrobiales bacterium]
MPRRPPAISPTTRCPGLTISTNRKDAALISTDGDAAAARWLLSPEAVRTQAHGLLAAAERNELQHFSFDAGRLGFAADYVTGTIRQNYPALDIPYHARWRHFVVDGTDRWAASPPASLDDPLERARIRIDLAVTSVLLDAGAGDAWRYRDAKTGKSIARSEGLAIASLDAFLDGLFSADVDQPARTDAPALTAIDDASLAAAFQVTDENPLAGLSGRTGLLNRLGHTLQDKPQFFAADAPRIGNLADHFVSLARDGTLPAATILTTLLEAFADIWPGRLEMAGRNLGDTWRHPAAHRQDAADGHVPFHKLSQWLSYSLVEPLSELGLAVTGPDDLTGLAEYRNGGLMIDTGLLRPKHDGILSTLHEPGSEIIVEWRALTVALLDRLADAVRERLGKTPAELPLAAVLEGGTWAAGRRIARETRTDGSPPLNIVSDGSVF